MRVGECPSLLLFFDVILERRASELRGSATHHLPGERQRLHDR